MSKIVITPKLEKLLDEVDQDIAQGRVIGPFTNADKAIKALKEEDIDAKNQDF